MFTRLRISSQAFVGPVRVLYVVGILWSVNWLFVVGLKSNPFVLAGARAAVAVPILWLCLRYCLIRFRWPNTWSQQLAVFFWVANTLLLTVNYQVSPGASAGLLHYSGLAFLPIAEYWFRKKRLHKNGRMTKGDCIGAGLAFIGACFMAGTPDPRTSALGNTLGVLCGLSLAAMHYYWRQSAVDAKSGEMMKMLLACDICTLVISLVGVSLTYQDKWEISKNLHWFLALGIIPWALPNLGYCWSIRKVPPVRAMVATSLEPVGTAIWPMFWLAQFPTMGGYIGGGLILAGVIYATYAEAQRTDGPLRPLMPVREHLEPAVVLVSEKVGAKSSPVFSAFYSSASKFVLPLC